MKKILFIITGLTIAIISCTDHSKTKWIREETKYFYFERPDNMKVADTVLITKDDIDYLTITFQGFTIEFESWNPNADKINFFNCTCTDYTDSFLDEHAQFLTINNQAIRIVEAENEETHRFWLDLCINNEYGFFIKEVEKQNLKIAEKILLSIKMK